MRWAHNPKHSAAGTLATRKATAEAAKRRRRNSCEEGRASAEGAARSPLDHAAAIQTHRLAHALEQEYFVGVAGRSRNQAKGAGKRVKGGTQNELVGGDAEQCEWVRDLDTLSSCDSDKSCSPGANRNNRYNISEAHRAYLASNKPAHQIQASMFVTTAHEPASGGAVGGRTGPGRWRGWSPRAASPASGSIDICTSRM